MSDWDRITDELAQKLNFQNTFFDAEPRLDILHPNPEHLGRYDVVVCSEVFEHIPPPVQLAFDNLAKLLRPGGFVVFSVPWVPMPQTREHFPDLFEWTIEQEGGKPVLFNRTRHGVRQRFDDLVFHGGPGMTLEMRLFSRDGLLANFATAGFSRVDIAKMVESKRYGIVFDPWSRGLIARHR